ncbi:MAG: SAM-dependent DNA methyltransferase, partial [Gammaproteobacteria bacterium]|nr:SAM-dependent DNA methyltransferase [Gammaproteobacteria bacterium]
MFEQAFRNIDDALRKEAGCATELDYAEQTSWLLFLKYLDGLEQDRATEAQLEEKKYAYILDKPYRWDTWAAPKDKSGQLDHNNALSGDDLRDFVNQKLFPYLHKFKDRASGPNTIEYKIGEIFGELKNKITSGYNLREIIDHVDELRFRSQTEKHELSMLYEEKIKRMGNAGRNGGEYYTPR